MSEEHQKNIRNILIVDDSVTIREHFKEFFSSRGFTVTSAEDGIAALEIFRETFIPVVITDLEMPNMGGHELIGHLKQFQFKPVIIVLTSHADKELIIKIMRSGIFDYIIKPVSPDEILLKVERACQVAEMNKINQITRHEKVLRIEQQLEWYKWVERESGNYSTENEQSLFTNLHRSFCQGTSFGAQMSILDMILGNIKCDDETCHIDKRYINILSDTHTMVKKAIDNFSELANLIENDIKIEQISCASLYDLIKESVNNLRRFEEVNNHSIILSDKQDYYNSKYLKLNIPLINKLVHEILINAMKFSTNNTRILVLFSTDETTLKISVINEPAEVPNTPLGIPTEYENIVFEPFYRISHVVFEQYQTLDFGLGLSLTEQIMKRHGGTISLFNITDNSDLKTGPVKKVNCLLEFPLSS